VSVSASRIPPRRWPYFVADVVGERPQCVPCAASINDVPNGEPPPAGCASGTGIFPGHIVVYEKRLMPISPENPLELLEFDEIGALTKDFDASGAALAGR
jgi:hypothetical protein